jgi:hypothetical protein
MNFREQGEAFRRFLRTVPRPPVPADGRKVLVPVLPWTETAVPWYSIALALLERARGFQPVLLFDDLPPPNPGESSTQIGIIAETLAALAGSLAVRRLSELPAGPTRDIDVALLDRRTEHNLPYLERSGVGDADSVRQFRQALGERIGRVRALVAEGGWDHLLLPGGIYGVSGLLRELGAEVGIRTPCYDSGPGAMTLGTDAIAGHCRDLGRIFDPEFADYLAKHREAAISGARREFNLRMQARDRYDYQTSAYRAGAGEEFGVLIPMNVFDDSAAIGRSRLFSGPREWMEETTDFILHQTEATLVVREHPGMRWLGRKDFIGGPLRERFGAHPRFRFVAAREEVSTYNLLEKARVVLPYASTVGVEAALLGKHVIMETDAYYARLPFVQRASSREDYFARIGTSLAAPEPLAEELRDQAWLSYFFSQVANFVDSEFTPQPVDFPRWVQRGFSSLAADPQIKIIVTVLADGIPSWRLQSERIFAEAAALESAPRFSWRRLWSRPRPAGQAAKP